MSYDKLLYVDTDSIIFIQNKYDKPGNYLGQLTDEFEPVWEIIWFIGLGPKKLCYRKRDISTGKVEDIMKIRGITLNYRARKEINFELLNNLVMEKSQKKVIFQPNIICRKSGFVILSRPETKTSNDHQETVSYTGHNNKL